MKLKGRHTSIYIKTLAAMVFSWSFFSCSSGENSLGNKKPSLENGGPSLISVAHASSYIEHNGEKIAYVLGLSSNTATLYVPTIDRYLHINIRTGRYIDTGVYFSEVDCLGLVFTSSFPGISGKAIIFSNDKYYLVTNSFLGFSVSYFSNTNFFVKDDSFEKCYNSPYETGSKLYGGAFSLNQINRPYNFERIAPLKIKFE